MSASQDNSFTENTFGDLSYTFLEPVPNYLTCIICFGLLKEPVATECCGKMFCYEDSPRNEEACPACRHSPLAVSRNKGIDSIVKDLKVFCLNHKEGCPWSGHLCFEPEHRNTCEFEVVSCSKGCGTDVQRRHMETHLSEDCSQRDTKCDFCELSVLAVELATHQESCPARAREMRYPRGCEMILPWNMTEGQSSTSPDQVVPCPFADAGCNQQVKHKDLFSHIQSFAVEHLLLVSAENVSLRKELLALKREQAAMKQEKKDMRLELQLSKEKCDELGKSLALLQQNAQSFWHTFLMHQSGNLPEKLPMIFSNGKFQEHFIRGVDCYSPRFYTRSVGYLMCLCMFPNGLNSSCTDCMSVTVLALPGVYDDTLKWPMEGSLKVEILNQLGDHSHYGKTLELVEMPKKYRERPKQDPTRRKETGWGIARFIDHHSLFAESDSCRYVVNGTVYMRITSGE